MKRRTLLKSGAAVVVGRWVEAQPLACSRTLPAFGRR